MVWVPDEDKYEVWKSRSLSPAELREKSKEHYARARSAVRYAGSAKEVVRRDFPLPLSPMGFIQAPEEPPIEEDHPRRWSLAKLIDFQYGTIIPEDLAEARRDRWLARRYRKMAQGKERKLAARLKRTEHARTR